MVWELLPLKSMVLPVIVNAPLPGVNDPEIPTIPELGSVLFPFDRFRLW